MKIKPDDRGEDYQRDQRGDREEGSLPSPLQMIALEVGTKAREKEEERKVKEEWEEKGKRGERDREIIFVLQQILFRQ